MNERINLQDLAALLAEKMAITKKEAETFLREYFDVLNEELINSGLIKIKDLGTFRLLPVEDRESVDVTTGERVLIPAHYKVAFTPDKNLAETVNEPFAFFETTEIEGESMPEEELQPLPEEYVAEDSEQLLEEEDEAVIEKSSPVEEEAVIKALVTENKDEKTVLSEPVVEEEQKPAHKQAVRNICLNCRDYEGHLVFRKKYFVVWKQLRMLMVIIWILSVLLMAALGYIVYTALYNNNPIAKIILPEVRGHVSPRKAVPENSPVLIDSIAPVKRTVNQDSIEKVVPPEITDESKQTTISSGDRLTSIAQKEYGDKAFWIYIYLENKAVIRNPNVLPVGATIFIPPAGKYGIDCNDPASIQKAKDMAIGRP